MIGHREIYEFLPKPRNPPAFAGPAAQPPMSLPIRDATKVLSVRIKHANFTFGSSLVDAYAAV